LLAAGLEYRAADAAPPTHGATARHGSLGYSGQFEYLKRANARLKAVVQAPLLIIFVLLY
jgi:Cu(I)/Ag(I) efflux system membrane protein CusA/SilA